MTEETITTEETINPDEAQTEEKPEESTAPGTGEQQDDTPSEKPKPNGFQKRIKKLVKQKHELRERLERAEAELAKLKNPPSEEEFESDIDFINARIEHETEKRLLEREKAEAAKQVETLETEEQVAQRQAYHDVLRTGAEKHEDFTQKVLTIPLPDYVAQAVMATDNPVEVFYHLGNNPLEAIEIAALSPEEAAERVKGIKIATTTTTKAPPPVAEPAAPGGTATSAPLRDDLPMDEWIRRREASLRGE